MVGHAGSSNPEPLSVQDFEPPEAIMVGHAGSNELGPFIWQDLEPVVRGRVPTQAATKSGGCSILEARNVGHAGCGNRPSIPWGPLYLFSSTGDRVSRSKIGGVRL